MCFLQNIRKIGAVVLEKETFIYVINTLSPIIPCKIIYLAQRDHVYEILRHFLTLCARSTG